MAHVLTIVEGPKTWYDLFLYDLENRQYTYRATHGRMGIIGPSVREIHILDIAVPEQNLEDLLADLAPFVGSEPYNSKSKKSAAFLQKAVWIGGKLSSFFKGTKLHKIPYVNPTEELRVRPLNILPLFWFEDDVALDKNMILPKKGNGGELL